MLRQLRNYFPDSRLKEPTSEPIINQFLASPDRSADVSFDDFLKLLMAVQRPDTPSDGSSKLIQANH